MKTLIILTIISLTTVPNTLALDDFNRFNNFYIKGGAGYSWYNKYTYKNINNNNKNKLKNLPIFEIGVGYYVNDQLRTDITFNYRKTKHYMHKNNVIYGKYNTKINHLNVQNMSLMLNMYYKITPFANISPFINAGIGIGKNSNKSPSIIDNIPIEGLQDEECTIVDNGKKTSGIWYIGAGTSFEAGAELFIDLNYRFINLGKINNSIYTQSTTNPSINSYVRLAKTSSIKSHEFLISLRKNI